MAPQGKPSTQIDTRGCLTNPPLEPNNGNLAHTGSRTCLAYRLLASLSAILTEIETDVNLRLARNTTSLRSLQRRDALLGKRYKPSGSRKLKAKVDEKTQGG